MRRFVYAAIVLAAISLARGAYASETPSWCPKTHVCLTLKEASDLAVRKIELERDLALAKSRTRRLGFTLGCGPGVATVVSDEYEVNLVPTPLECGLKFGWRFR